MDPPVANLRRVVIIGMEIEPHDLQRTEEREWSLGHCSETRSSPRIFGQPQRCK